MLHPVEHAVGDWISLAYRNGLPPVRQLSDRLVQ